MRRALIAMACAGLGACISNDAAAPGDPHTQAIAYLDSALTLMKTRAFYRRSVNWDSVRDNAMIQAAGATTPGHTYPAIRQSLLALNDHHSFLNPPAGATLSTDLGAMSFAGTTVDSLHAEVLDGKYGFIHVPTFSGPNQVGLADTLQALVKAIDLYSPCGWIVDLRHNRGGNMWPMLAGVGPILGNDLYAGAFIDADSVISKWYYENGAAGIIKGGVKSEIVRTSRPAYALTTAGQSVAVLTDSLTASSGEAITVAFRGLSRTRSFGGATAGVPTANSGFFLPDNAMLFLMVALDADRLGNWYDDRIMPDTPFFLATYPATDDVVATLAKNWLATQPGCS